MTLEGTDQSQAGGLGFEMNTEVNLFELFAQNQGGESSTKPLDVNDELLDPNNKGRIANPTNTNQSQQGGQQQNQQQGGQQQQQDDQQQQQQQQNDQAALDLINGFTKGGQSGAPGQQQQQSAPGKDNQQQQNQKPAGSENVLTVLYNNYTEKGTLEKLPEGEEFKGEDEDLDRAIEHTVEARLDDRVEAYVQEAFNLEGTHKDLATRFVRHLAKKGDPREFIEAVRHSTFNAASLDDVNTQVAASKELLTSYFSMLNVDKTVIDANIQRLEAAGGTALVDQAKVVLPAYQTESQKRITSLETTTNAAAIKRQQDAVALNTGIKTAIDKSKTVLGYDISTKKAKDALNNYMYAPTEEYNGQKVPKFFKDRIAKANSPEFQTALAILMMNDFKIDGAAATTQVTKTLKDRLTNLQTGNVNTTGSGAEDQQQNNLALPDAFDFEPDSVINLGRK